MLPFSCSVVGAHTCFLKEGCSTLPVPILIPSYSHTHSSPFSLPILNPSFSPLPPQLFFIYKEYLPKHCIWAVFFFAAVIVVQSVFTDVLVFSYDKRVQ